MKTIEQLNLNPADFQAIQEAASVLRSQFPVDQLVLFGSKATGEDHEESDIDLLVLTTEPLTWDAQIAVTHALFDVNLRHGVVISTLIVSTQEWNEGVYQVLPIHDEVGETGVLI